jgi:fusion protein PurCD
MFRSPQLRKLCSGKVRDSYRVDDERRLLVVSDRISCFDDCLETPIPGKGAILNGLSNAWFERTRQIIDNHFLAVVDPNVTLVREAEPIRIEMIIRGFLTGSIWRRYQKGERTFSGVTLPDDMVQFEAFPEPIITPTTKEASDRPISRDEIIAEGRVARAIYEEMEQATRQLYDFGQKLCAKKSLVLVDTKYEFGMVDGKLILIDELHTPDSSRYWVRGSHEWMDKEFVRQWLLKQNPRPNALADDVVKGALQRYRQVYELLLSERLQEVNVPDAGRIYEGCVKAGLIHEGFVAIICGSPTDLEQAWKIRNHLDEYGVHVDVRVGSAHKNAEDVVNMAAEYNSCFEPGVVIAIAGRSNGLGGALAANLALPVISCPPLKDRMDYMVNINSSLMMPSNTPSATVIDPLNAAQCALRALNLRSLRGRLKQEIKDMKKALRAEDKRLVEECRV